MPVEQVIDLSRMTLKEVLLVGSPILALAIVVSLVINVVQVLTSLQEVTISAVPRLLTVGGGIFLLTPWIWRQLCQFTVMLLSDFHPYLR
ncbi:MAG: flagellar biosynthetic protein FliQ [Terriglobales bacterium]